MLKQRILTALILFLLTITCLFILPNLAFSFVSVILCVLGVYELTNMYNFDRINQIGLMTIICLILLMLYFINYDSSQVIRMLAITTWCFIVPITLIWQPKVISKPALSIIAILLFIPSFYALVILRDLLGPWQLVSLMGVAWAADTGAYFIGKHFGQHKLAPSISPGKSIEGACGGLILVVVYLVLLKYFNLAIYLYDYASVFKFALILTTASIVGDLFESWLKRRAGVKDSGTILPGHGGILDRIDSLLAVLALAFAMIRGFI